MTQETNTTYQATKHQSQAFKGCPFCGPAGQFTLGAGCDHVFAERSVEGLTYSSDLFFVPHLLAQITEWSFRADRYPTIGWEELAAGIAFLDSIQGESLYYEKISHDLLFSGRPGIQVAWNPTWKRDDASTGSRLYYFADPSCRQQIVADLKELSRRLFNENVKWNLNPERFASIQGAYSSPYPPALMSSAHDLQQEIARPWTYHCPFCMETVDSGPVCTNPCPHLALFGVPGYQWLGSHSRQSWDHSSRMQPVTVMTSTGFSRESSFGSA